MSKFCTNCGYECADEAAFCGNCGKPFPTQTAPVFNEPAEPVIAEPAPAAPVFENPAPTEGNYYSAPQTNGTYYAPAPAPAPKPKKKNGALIAVIIGAAVIIAVLLGIIIFGGNDVPPAAEPSYPATEETPIFTPVPEAPSEAPSYSANGFSSGLYFAEQMIYEDEFYDVEDVGVSGYISIDTYSETYELYLIIDGESNSVDGTYIYFETDGELSSYALYAGSEYFGALIYDSSLDLYIVEVVDTDIMITFE